MTNDLEAQKRKKEIEQFLKDKRKSPCILAWNNNGNVMCFAGTFSVEELCVLKEVVVRKIDSMLDNAIKMGVDFKPKEGPKDAKPDS